MYSGTQHAVLFDMDGVLTDSEPLINAAAVAMFRELGLTVQPEDFHPFVGTGENRYLGGVAAKYGFPIDLPSAKRRTYEIYLDLVPTRLRAFPGAVDLVRACRAQGFKIALASSADRIKIDANLDHIGLPPSQWDAIVTGEDVEHKKPAPDIFLAAARRLAVPAHHCVVIEDAVNGIQAARAAGMRCVAVAQSFPADQLRAADLVLPTVADIQPADLRGPWNMAWTGAMALVVAAAFIVAWGLADWGLGFGLADHPGVAVGEVHATDFQGLSWAVATLAAAPTGAALTWLFASIRPGWSARTYLALRPVTWGAFGRWALVTGAFVVAADALTRWIGRPVVPPVMLDAYRSAVIPPLLWLALVAGAPAGEELLFRGFLFRGLLHSRLGATGAILTTAAAWAVIHSQYDPFEKGLIFGAGLLLGWARYQSGSLWVPLGMHAAMNLVATCQAALHAV